MGMLPLWTCESALPTVTSQVARTGSFSLEIPQGCEFLRSLPTFLQLSQNNRLLCLEAFVRGQGTAELSLKSTDTQAGMISTSQRAGSTVTLSSTQWQPVTNRLLIGPAPIANELAIRFTGWPAFVDDVSVWFSSGNCDETP
jgi:hypothetical protein